MPITDFNVVWSKPDDLPSELDMLNQNNIKPKSEEDPPSIKEEERQNFGMLPEKKVSDLAVFNQ